MNKNWEAFKNEKDECEYLFNVNEREYIYFRIVDVQEVLGESFKENRYRIMCDNVDVDDIDESFIDDIIDEYEDESDVSDFVLAAEYSREDITESTTLDTLDDVIDWVRDNIVYKSEQLISNIVEDIQ